MKLDVLYMVKPADSNEELRHSLRTLENIKDFSGRVFMAGYVPKWARNVYQIRNLQNKGSKSLNVRSNWRLANECEELSDDYILMNDDFFILKPIDSIPVLYRDPKYLRRRQPAAANTSDVLKKMGVSGQIKDYELHVPMVFNKRKRSICSEVAQNNNLDDAPTLFRTIYGNYYGLGGREVMDVKVYNKAFDPKDYDVFLSSSDISWAGPLGQWIRDRFPNRSIYEDESYNPD